MKTLIIIAIAILALTSCTKQEMAQPNHIMTINCNTLASPNNEVLSIYINNTNNPILWSPKETNTTSYSVNIKKGDNIIICGFLQYNFTVFIDGTFYSQGQPSQYPNESMSIFTY